VTDALWPEPSTPRELDLVGLGQSSIDHVALVDGLPEFATKEPLLAYARLPGGQIATALLAAARLGLRGAFLGSVGDDEASLAVLAPLRRAGVDVSGVRVRAGTPTQLAIILVDRESGERTVLWYRDPRLRLRSGELRRDEITRARALHLDPVRERLRAVGREDELVRRDRPERGDREADHAERDRDTGEPLHDTTARAGVRRRSGSRCR